MKKILKSFLWLLLILFILIALLIALPMKSPPLVGNVGDFAFKNVNIINTKNGSVLSNKTVLIQQGIITQIIPNNAYQADANFIEIDARGKYLMPGLWDMHTHGLKLSPQLHHALFIANGVTSVRDMSGCLSEKDSYWACPADRVLWEQQAVKGLRVSPRYPLQSSYQTNGGNEVPVGFPEYFKLNSFDDAQKLVAFYVKQKVDFIKTYTELTQDQYNNLVLAAQQKQLAIAGHKPLSISLTQALNSDISSIEHGRLFMFECFTGMEKFRQHEDPISLYNSQFIRDMLENQDKEKCDALMASMARSNTRWVPTLTTLKMSAMANESVFRNDSRLKYIPYIVQKLLWEPDISRASEKGYDQSKKFVHTDFFATAQSQVGRAHGFGVKILAGSDNIDSYVFTGSSLHDELAMLVETGLSPLEAIQSATINPAIFSNLDNDFGSVEPKKQADLILLNKNPLSDIKHVSDIEGVMFAGQYFDKAALKSLDKFSVDSAQSIQVNLKYLYKLVTSPLMRVQLAD